MENRKYADFLADCAEIIFAAENRFYIWGAGTAGKSLIRHLSGEPLSIAGFVDANSQKRAGYFEGYSVISPDEIPWTQHTKVILASLDYPEGMEQFLSSIGKKENRDYFFSNIFLAVYMMQKYRKVYLHHVNVSITDYCTLRCKDCSFCIPYYTKRNIYPFDQVIAGLNALFETVDYVQELHLIGGEPMLYRQLPQLAAEIGSRHRHQIGEFAIATNGSLLPGQELCEICKQFDIFFTISDYRGSPVFSGPSLVDELVPLLEKMGVSYRIGNKSAWVDFCNPVPQTGYPQSTLADRFQTCFFRNRGLYLDKLYYCQHQYGMFRAGREEADSANCLSVNKLAKDQILAFELGFLQRGYLKHCARCNGFERLNTNMIDGAAQCEGGPIG